MPRVAGSATLASSRAGARPHRRRDTSRAGTPPIRTAASVPNAGGGPATVTTGASMSAGRLVERADQDDAARPAAGRRSRLASSGRASRPWWKVTRRPEVPSSARPTVSAVGEIGRRRAAGSAARSRRRAASARRWWRRRAAGAPTSNSMRGFGPDRQAVADIAHVDAAILRRRARIEEGELEEAVRGLVLRERHADGAAWPCRRARSRRRCDR